MAHKPGDRVGAIFNADSEVVRLLGWGVYDGDLPCPILGGRNNPRITLDNEAGTVWGCQCWWGNEEAMKTWAGKRTVLVVDLEGKER